MVRDKEANLVEWFLRIALSIGLLSAVADRIGLWPKEMSAWGNWKAFTDYTGTLLNFLPASVIPALAAIATGLEIIFGVALSLPFKTRFFAQATGALLICFGLAMAVSLNIKAPLDYSVFIGAAACALGYICKMKR